MASRLTKIVEELKLLEAQLSSHLNEKIECSGKPPYSTRALRAEIETTIKKLSLHTRKLDPIEIPEVIFDPSDVQTLGRLIADTLLNQPRHSIADLRRFYGSGVYALYYGGDFSAYHPIKNFETPIYVGKSDPASPTAVSVMDQGEKLRHRIASDHARSIQAAENLELADFTCRYLVVRSAWQVTAETYLISRFHPVWNSESNVCEGFGKHGDDPRTRSNVRSPWDEIHPGRKWAWKAGNVKNPKGREGVATDIAEHFRKYPPNEMTESR